MQKARPAAASPVRRAGSGRKHGSKGCMKDELKSLLFRPASPSRDTPACAAWAELQAARHWGGLRAGSLISPHLPALFCSGVPSQRSVRAAARGDRVVPKSSTTDLTVAGAAQAFNLFPVTQRGADYTGFLRGGFLCGKKPIGGENIPCWLFQPCWTGAWRGYLSGAAQCREGAESAPTPPPHHARQQRGALRV